MKVGKTEFKMIYYKQTNQAEGPIYPYGRCFLLSPLWFPKNDLISGLVILSKPKVRLYLRDPVNEAKSLRLKGFTIVTWFSRDEPVQGQDCSGPSH